jgi:hypothetical protein
MDTIDAEDIGHPSVVPNRSRPERPPLATRIVDSDTPSRAAGTRQVGGLRGLTFSSGGTAPPYPAGHPTRPKPTPARLRLL